MAITKTRTADEFVALADQALEVAITTCMDTTLVSSAPGGAVRKVTRAQVVKALARRMLRKATQPGMRKEVSTSPVVTVGV